MQKDEIKEILDRFNFVKKEPNKLSYYPEDLLTREEMWLLYDYITNLQEKSNNQAEEINRLYKQREKFMKKYGYLQEEKDKLKELCDKYEEEHSTTFEYWKQLVKEDYKSRNEKAIEYIRNNAWYCYKDNEENLDRIGIEKILSILGNENE